MFGGGSSLGVRLKYSEDQMPRGPAGCVKDASEFWTGAETLVLEGGLVPVRIGEPAHRGLVLLQPAVRKRLEYGHPPTS